jgi:SAM-dependent methyltransferase
VTFTFADKTCTAPAARSRRMRDLVVEAVSSERAIRLLDLGCGTGSLLFLLADAFPAAQLMGVDVSPANIDAAEQVRRAHPAAARLRFVTGDYVASDLGRFDVIVSDGVLHLIPGDSTALFRKIAADLHEAGLFICAMPFDCLYNRGFAVIRRCLRAIRSRPLDAAILLVGRLLHGREMDTSALRERIPYMYFPPIRMADRNLLQRIAPSFGLHVVGQHPMASTSLSQLRHNVTVFAKGSARTS